MKKLALVSLLTSFVFLAPLSVSAQACTSAGTSCDYGSGPGTCTDTGDGFSCTPSAQNPSPSTNQNPSPTGNPSAQNTTNTSNITLVNPLGSGVGLMELLNKILDFVIKIGTIVVIFMIVYVGYLFVAAQGEPGKITEARKALLWTVVGALILLGAKAIAIGIQATVQALSVGR